VDFKGVLLFGDLRRRKEGRERRKRQGLR